AAWPGAKNESMKTEAMTQRRNIVSPPMIRGRQIDTTAASCLALTHCCRSSAAMGGVLGKIVMRQSRLRLLILQSWLSKLVVALTFFLVWPYGADVHGAQKKAPRPIDVVREKMRERAAGAPAAQPKILDGTPAAPGEFPFQVALIDSTSDPGEEF